MRRTARPHAPITVATNHAPPTFRIKGNGKLMSMASRFTKLLLARTPSPIRTGIRKLTPQWAYQAIARASAGGPLRAMEPGQLFLSDKRVIALEERLWQGFANAATGDLEAMLDKQTPTRQRAEAAMVLARFHAVNGAHVEALDRLELAGRILPPLGNHRRARIIKIHSLLRLGRLDEAQAAAEQALHACNAYQGDLGIASASVAMAKARRQPAAMGDAVRQYLAGINRCLETAGHVGLALRDPGQPLAIDNLAPERAPPSPASMPAKVSVLMAVHNRQDHVRHAIGSVLAQTWHNLELVVVDDASSDDSWAVIQQLAAHDARIMPIRLTANGGAYVARNTALRRATGDFVTVHDADDWSHPQKIEAQVTALLRGDKLGNTTDWLRVMPDMQAQPRLDLFQVPIIHKNFSSLMLPRKKALELGGWDTVRMSADAEFIERIEAHEGGYVLETLSPGVPLSLSLLESGNLTTSTATGIRTSHFGARHAYARQYREWHRSGTDLHMSRQSQADPFPVPGICYRPKSVAAAFDLVVVSDFRDARILQTCRERTTNMAILPWPDYRLDHELSISNEVVRWCRETGTITLVHGEQAHCRRLLIDPPDMMSYLLDQAPDIHADEVVILEHAGKPALNRSIIDRHVARVFGVVPRWSRV